MTELVPDPSRAQPRRGKWVLIFILVLLGLALAYYVGQRTAHLNAPPEPPPVMVELPPVPVMPPAPVVVPNTPPLPPVTPAPVVAKPAEPAVVAPPVAKPGVTPVMASNRADQASALAEAEASRKTGRLQEAREKAQAALEQAAGDPAQVQEAEKLLGAIHTELIMTPRPMAEKTDYTVLEGDSLDKIARKYGTTVELIQKSNNVRGALIRAGDRLRVFSGAWAIRVNKTRNDLLLTLDGKFFKRYQVGTGEYSKTPVGEFKIVDRIAQPTWWHPDGRTIPFGDPENLLGTHWLALDIRGYGIHGTWEPETIGKQASMGCVRLVNSEVEELFTLVTIGTPVIIEE